MPTYAYICRNCDVRFDQFQKMSEEPVRQCVTCGELAVERLPSAGAGLHFQGSGFYKTDYGSDNAKPTEKGNAGSCQTDCACC